VIAGLWPKNDCQMHQIDMVKLTSIFLQILVVNLPKNQHRDVTSD
jgi:hypothetical protein